MKNIAIQEKLINFLKDNTKSNDLYWYPMTELKTSIPVVAYNLDKIYEENKIDLLEKVFKKLNIEYVDTFCMDNEEYFEKDIIIELLKEKHNNNYSFPKVVETFYFDKSYTWLVYVSHEGTITFTGKTIVKTAKEIIPNKYIFI